ncbi:glycine--tRNA ligase [Candidatus Dependentiae bacterium]|nr:glycine--tRNA ligase [Candidatus Dependentiae bacterium]MCC7415122.1 glycine--tRNA ligase [Campylobacterota bacterium]
MQTPVTLDALVSLCKRRGFVYQSAEIYGGLNGVYDFGPLGALLKQNIKSAWMSALNSSGRDIVYLDGAILGAQPVWQASGHVTNFNDPMIDCLTCKKRYRADDDNIDTSKPCPHCGNTTWTAVRQFNMMFKTEVGAASDQSSIAYLRPETAQAIFVNFKNVISTTRVKIPFGIAQIGKAFRNEITPKQFLFRMREFEQMEIEWFCKDEYSLADFEVWCQERLAFYASIGITADKIRLRPHVKDELAHYAQRCTDVEYQFPFGWKELEGIAHRGSFDLTQHSTHSGKDLSVFEQESSSSYVPTVVECSVGVDRLFLTLLFDAYHEDIVEGEKRIVLRLHPRIAPVKAAFLPLVKKLSEPMEKLYRQARQAGLSVQYDESGSIGKRYRRQDEIGTPLCITYDFDSENDQSVTIRDRDTTEQKRMPIDQVLPYVTAMMQR